MVGFPDGSDDIISAVRTKANLSTLVPLLKRGGVGRHEVAIAA
jgi:hypothetical protein